MGVASPPRPATTIACISNPVCGRHDTGWGHPEHVGRIRAIPSALRNEPELLMRVQHVESRHATVDELLLAHDGRYIASVRDIAARGGGRFDADTVVSEGSWDAATAGAGAVLDAIDFAFGDGPRRSLCAVRAPGHLALRANAMGFCFFGNVALGAKYARNKHGAERVLILDWDVHHGTGTQALVAHEENIHFVSLHQWPWYPGTGSADDRGPHENVWNLPMRAGLPRTAYVDANHRGIDAATQGFTPDLVLISAGFDSLAGDPLGGFTLEFEDVELLTREIVERAYGWCDGRDKSTQKNKNTPERHKNTRVRHM